METAKKVLTIKITDFYSGEVAEYTKGNEAHTKVPNNEKVKEMARILKRWIRWNKEWGNTIVNIKVESNSKKAKEVLEGFIRKEVSKMGGNNDEI